MSGTVNLVVPHPAASACPRAVPTRLPFLSGVAALRVHIGAEIQAEAEDTIGEITRFDADVTALAALSLGGEDSATELAPRASVLLRAESACSSAIEGSHRHEVGASKPGTRRGRSSPSGW